MTKKTKNIIAELEGEFGKIFVEENEDMRYLRFDSEAHQASLLLKEPASLQALPLQYMLLPLLFSTSSLDKVLLAGIGGGDLVRFLNSHFKSTYVNSIDRDATILDIAKKYFQLPEANANINYIVEDARTYLDKLASDQEGAQKNKYKLIVIDLHIEKGMPDFLDQPVFYENCYKLLNEQGVLALNILPNNKDHLIHIMQIIRETFDKRCLYAAIPNHNNIAIYAFREFPDKDFSYQDIEENASKYTTQYKIDFLGMWQELLKVNPLLHQEENQSAHLSDLLPK